jgi:hypothetical protein
MTRNLDAEPENLDYKYLDDVDYPAFTGDIYAFKTCIMTPTAARTITFDMSTWQEGDWVTIINRTTTDIVFSLSSGTLKAGGGTKLNKKDGVATAFKEGNNLGVAPTLQS